MKDERLLHAEIDALRTVLTGYVHDIEQARTKVEVYQSALNDARMENENLMEQVHELRTAWTASRHYKRLRNYSHRLTEATRRAEKAEAALANIKAFTEDPFG